MSTIVIVCVALVALPQSSVAVNTRIIWKFPIQSPWIVSVASVITTVPQLSLAEDEPKGCSSEHSAV